MSSKALKERDTGYDRDFQLWLEQQTDLLRQRRFDELDLDNLIEEIDAIARRDKREVESRLIVLLIHLLKYRYQAQKQSRSWLGTMDEQRLELELVFRDSPSLRAYAASVLASSYAKARKRAVKETRLGIERFPATCPYSLSQILDEDFFPEG